MTLEEFYVRVGGDYAATLRRLPSENLIRKFIMKYPADTSYEKLRTCLESEDWANAFRAAHTLKGVAQNLGMDRLYQASSTLCEAVRDGKPLTDASLWPAVEAANREVLAAIEEL